MVMPLPRRRKDAPLCVPGGMLMRARSPLTVGTSTVPPGAVALEQSVRRHRNEDVEVAGWPAAHAGLALARQSDAGAVLDARWNRHLQRLFALHPAGAAARAAGIANHLAAAAAARTGTLDGEEAVLRAHPAGAAA